MFCPLQIVCFKTDGEQARKLCWLTFYSQKDKHAVLCKINFALIFLFFREFNLSAKVILLETFVNKLSPVLSNLRGKDDNVKVVKKINGGSQGLER